jgi:Carboxypeptidase regulatory-like domain
MLRFFTFQVFFTLVTLIGLTACGGGTTGSSGTGGGPHQILTIRGSLSNTEGVPIAGALVRVKDGSEGGKAGEKTESTTTDQAGVFQLIALAQKDLALTVEAGGQSLDLAVPEVAPEASVVTVDAQIDGANKSATVVSLDGDIRVNGPCKPYATVNGDTVRFRLPKNEHECTITYTFRSSARLGRATAEISSTTCSDLRATTQGNQVNGNQLLVYQGITIGSLRSACRALMRVNITGVKSPSLFTVQLAQGDASSGGGRSDPPSDNSPGMGGDFGGSEYVPDSSSGEKLSGVYRGVLSLIPNDTSIKGCDRFLQDQLALTFAIQDSQMSVEIPSESMTLVGPIRSAAPASQRYSVGRYFPRNNALLEVNLDQVTAPTQANFHLKYYSLAREGERPCLRNFRGTLEKE